MITFGKPGTHKVWLLVLASWLFVFPAFAVERQSSLTLHIVQDNAWAPLAFRDSQGQPQGLLIDLWRAVGEHSGKHIHFELVDWQQTLDSVRTSRQNIHGGLFRSPVRDNFLDFSVPLMQLRTTLFINSRLPQKIIDLDDLAAAQGTQPIGIIAGGYEEEFMRSNHPLIALKTYANNQLLIQAAVQGEINGFVADYPVGLYYLEQLSTPDKFRVLAVLYTQSLHAAVAKGNDVLLNEINTALQQLTAEEINAITQKWMLNEPVEVIPAWLFPALFIAAGIMFIAGLLLHNMILKNKLKQQTAKLREQEKQVILLAKNMSDWIWTLNADQHFSYVSSSVHKLLGYAADELLDQDLSCVLHSSEIERAYALMSHMLAVARRGEDEKFKDTTIDLAYRHKNGQLVWAETAIRVFFDAEGNFTGAQGSSRNISERKKAEDALRHMAFNDPLTQIPNRRLLNDRVRHAQAGCERHKQYCALFFIDLDNFKYVNDNYGHDSGDMLLQQVAQRLFTSARESDTVARFGGDEFVVMSEFLNPDYEEARVQALLIGAKLIELFDKEFTLRDNSCRLGASIGLYLFNSDKKSFDYMIKQADTAMYQAKARGRNQLVICKDGTAVEVAV